LTLLGSAAAQSLRVVHAFRGPGPNKPVRLMQAADGSFYGTATGAHGTIFRLTPSGALTELSNLGPGASILVQGADGAFYGTHDIGGTFAYGDVFRFTLDGTHTTLYSFPDWGGATSTPVAQGPLLRASDGNFYWVRGAQILKMTPGGDVSVLYQFTGVDKPAPLSLIQGSDGSLYSATCSGSNGLVSYVGGIYSTTLDGSTTFVASIRLGSTYTCPSAFVRGGNGSFYVASVGHVFVVPPGEPLSVLHRFGVTEGSPASLVQGDDGNLYGTTRYGASGADATAFRLGLDGSFAVLHTFAPAEWFDPAPTLLLASDGRFYGTTAEPVVYRMESDGAYTEIHRFPYSTEGIDPRGLTRGSDGNYYGVSRAGGAYNWGSVFKTTTAGDVTTLYSFPGDSGAQPMAPMVQASDGNFYGTSVGGAIGVGTIFRITPSGTLTTLHTIANLGPIGTYPLAALLEASDGNFYGTTYWGSGANLGAVFRMTPSGTVSLVHAFSGGAADGGNPQAALIQTPDGFFYGTTDNGGTAGLGTVFRMTVDGTVTVLHAFTGGADGSHPRAALTPAPDGTFYGTTRTGGSANAGTVFRMTAAGTVTILYSFPGGAGGQHPEAPVIIGSDGDLYGTTLDGGAANIGTVFRMTPAGAITMLRPFSGPNGNTPYHALVDGGDGRVYGVAGGGGAGYGVIFRLQSAVPQDFGLDRKSDFAVYRPESRTWHLLQSGGGVVERQWGLEGDVPVPADYDGDGRTDIAVYRPSTGLWFILRSSADFNDFVILPFGSAGDVPVPGDYDGDGSTDLAVYRPSSGTWRLRLSLSPSAAPAVVALGRATDVPVPADYDGDGLTDPAVYRQTTGRWIIRWSARRYATSTTTMLGLPGDVPVAADYDGDGRADAAVYRPSSSTWYLQLSSGGPAPTALQWGLAGDVTAPADFDGDGKVDPAVFRPSNGTWFVLLSTTGYATHSETSWGLPEDVPLPNAIAANAMLAAAAAVPRSPLALSIRTADFGGDNRSDITVFRPSSGQWRVLESETSFTVSRIHAWGLPGDVPAPGDFDGDGTADAAVYRPSDGTWWVLKSSSGFTAAFTAQWGLDGDTPVPADYDGDGRAEIAIYRPYTGEWYIRWSASDYATWAVYAWGLAGDVPVPGDYDGDGLIDLAVHRPSDGVWYVRTSSSGYTAASQYQWGLAGDIAVPGDYDGDGRTDVAIYRPSSGGWYVLQSSGGFTTFILRFWGLEGDTPVAADYDGDGKTDLAVFRPGNAVWYILNSSTGVWESHQWGLGGDAPINGR
jgi:uncharacterized repeat protein (TIGR03803 family)